MNIINRDDSEHLNLYKIAINSISKNVNANERMPIMCRKLPDYVLFDLYYQVYLDKKATPLRYELCEINIFNRLLKVNQEVELIKIFQFVDRITNVSQPLIQSFISNPNPEVGLRLSAFLNTCAHYEDSTEVLESIKHLCQGKQLFECYYRLLYARINYCAFDECLRLKKKLEDLVDEVKINVAGLYSLFSFMYTMESEYDDALKWSFKALQELKTTLPVSVVVDVLRQASAACVLKRKFKIAGMLVKHALTLTMDAYPRNHPKTADVLIDYGFYLLSTDMTLQSVRAYNMAYLIQKGLFQRRNLKVAIAHQDLAYALYIKEYCTGHFDEAKEHAEEAMSILSEILPPNHLLFGISKRITALILEEIAIDLPMQLGASLNPDQQRKSMALLYQAESLHQQALQTCLEKFGEKNVQTAKHYGNLGRLYQTMKNYNKAEQMHLLAISIKSELLGDQDYETGLSIGHLASLYNYHMLKFKEAEELHLKSIQISHRLFGETYSGLEFDYRGLMRIYTELRDFSQSLVYENLFAEWSVKRVELDKDGDLKLDLKVTDNLDILLQKCINLVDEE